MSVLRMFEKGKQRVENIINLTLIEMRINHFFLLIMLVISGCDYVHAQNKKVPGVIVSHIAQTEEKYIGSPSICILPDGTYLASHDEFGTKSDEETAAVTRVFASYDRGQNWQCIATMRGQFWSTLFTIKGKVYLIGTVKAHGAIVIRCSTDGGHTWTTPKDKKTGLLKEGEFHTAPMPLIVHKGRIWRAVENASSPDERWPYRYSAMMMSAKVGSNLLKASNWRFTNSLRSDTTCLSNRFKGWLEGNAVVAPDGQLYDVLRCEVEPNDGEYAAFVRISEDGRNASFDVDNGFCAFQGGGKKFTIRYDEATQRYWTLVNPRYKQLPRSNRYSVRNMLVLCSSTDLRHWSMHEMVLFHKERWKHAFQYVDWLVEGNDIIFVSRTAYDDETGGVHSFHDANYMTFHRIPDFRSLLHKQLNMRDYEQ